MVALATALVGSGIVVGAAPPAAAPDNTVSIDLAGSWQFTTGDDPAFADPAFDDSAWTSIQVPGDGAPFQAYDGFAWYRLTFDLPAAAEGANLVASLGFIDDVDEAYLNGVRIGGSGAMPPNAKSQWFEKRLYPVPATAPVFGGENTIAVRLYDMNGGGGWYKGPVGIYSKDAVRENVFGISGEPASAAQVASVAKVLATQKAALAAGDADAYLATLGADYNHDGRDKERRNREIRSWIAQSGALTLLDSEVEVVVNATGLVVDTNRTISGTKAGVAYDFQPKTQQFLVIDPASNLEKGNQSRFFGDFVDSVLEAKRRSFQVYLPPSYYSEPNREYPVVYLLHGINGGSKEWEPRDFDAELDALYTSGGLAESIVIMPDGESLWYADTAASPWRSMFLTEMVPQVDAEYRTLDDPDFRALSGVSMGGFGAFSIGFDNPGTFTSLASHIGALSYNPNGATPIAQATAMTAAQLSHYALYFDACEFDEYRFDDAARSMDAVLTSKGVPHTSAVYPQGNHSDACWMPHIAASFGLHSDHFRAAGLVEDAVEPTVTLAVAPAENGSGWINTAATITATVVDARDAAPVVQYRVGASEWAAYTAPLQFAEDGEFAVEVRATDAAGNIGEAARALKVDRTAPTAKTAFEARTLRVEATDALSGIDRIEYAVGDDEFAIYTAPVPYPADAATVRVRAVDRAGNASESAVAVPQGAPAAAPVDAGEASLTAATKGGISVSDTTLRPGQRFTITMDTAYASSYVAPFVYSTPVSLGGWRLVAADGTIAATLPTTVAAGVHRVAVQDVDGVVIGWVEVTVTADGTVAVNPRLASTGADIAPVLLTGTLLLLFGATLVVARRRRKV